MGSASKIVAWPVKNAASGYRGDASPTRRWISSRTSRSTISGKWSFSQARNNGRTASRTISSKLRPPAPSELNSVGGSPAAAPSWPKAATAASEAAADNSVARGSAVLAGGPAFASDGPVSLLVPAAAGLGSFAGWGLRPCPSSFRTVPSGSIASVSSRIPLFSRGGGGIGRAGRLSLAMMRLIEAMISCIDNSGGAGLIFGALSGDLSSDIGRLQKARSPNLRRLWSGFQPPALSRRYMARVIAIARRGNLSTCPVPR